MGGTVFAAGEGSVAVGGSVTNSLVVAGDILYRQVAPAGVEPGRLAAALRRLAGLPSGPIPGDYQDLPAGSRVSFKPNALFVGRDDELRQLARAFKENRTVAIGQAPTVAATGIGGIGKTQLAIEFVHRYGYYFAGGVFWLNFSEDGQVPVEVAACGGPAALNLFPAFNDRPLAEQVARVLAAWQSPLPRLLVFDNCESEELLRQWRPPVGGCRVLLTSRRPDWNPALDVQVVALDVLDRQDSIALLHRLLPGPAARDDELDAIAAELGDLPLALHMAGSYLRSSQDRVTAAGYLAELRSPHLLRHPSLVKGGLAPTNRELHVARAFLLSYSRLDPARDDDRLALDLLPRAAHFAAGELIPRRLLRDTAALKAGSITGRRLIAGGLKRLVELGLLEEKGVDGSLRLHHLLGRFARTVVAPALEAEAQKAAENVILDTLQHSADPASLLSLQAHLRVVTAEALRRYSLKGDYDEAAAVQLLFDLHLKRWGQYQLIKERYEPLWAGISRPDVKVFSAINLGDAYKHLGEYQKAVDHYTAALELARTYQPLALGSLLGNLSNCYYHLGRTRRAIAQYKEALAIARETANIDQEAKWRIGLGNCYRAAGQTDLAIQQYQQAKTLAQSGANSRNRPTITGRSLNNLGLCYDMEGQTQAAIDCYRQTLALARQSADKWMEANALNNLGNSFTLLADFQKARDYLQQALTICREFGLQLDAGNVLHSLAELLLDERKYEQAIDCARQGAEIAQLARIPSVLCDNTCALALGYLHIGDLTAAAAAASTACAQKVPLKLPYALVLLGITLLRQGDRAAAGQTFHRAVGRAALLPRHYRALDCRAAALCGLALAGRGDQGTLAAAQQAYRQARAIHRGPAAAGRTAALLDQLGQVDEADLLRPVRALL